MGRDHRRLWAVRRRGVSRAATGGAAARGAHAQSRGLGRRALDPSGLSTRLSVGGRSAFLGRLRRGPDAAVPGAGGATAAGRGLVIMSPPVQVAAVKMTHMLWSARALAAVAMAAMLAACGQGAHKAGAGGQSQQNRDLSQGHKSADALDPDMVAAVSSAHSSTPISMKFRLAARPVVGSPLQ